MTLFTQTILGNDYVDFIARKALAYLRQQGRPIDKIEFSRLKAEFTASQELQNAPELLEYRAKKQQAYEGLTEAEKLEVQRAKYNPRLIVMAVYKRIKELEKTDTSVQEH